MLAGYLEQMGRRADHSVTRPPPHLDSAIQTTGPSRSRNKRAAADLELGPTASRPKKPGLDAGAESVRRSLAVASRCRRQVPLHQGKLPLHLTLWWGLEGQDKLAASRALAPLPVSRVSSPRTSTR